MNYYEYFMREYRNANLYLKLLDARDRVHDHYTSYFWKRTNQHYHWLISGFAYFTGTHLRIRDWSIRRSDYPEFVLNQIIDFSNRVNNESTPENYTPPLYDEENGIPYRKLLLNIVNVSGQITSTFENIVPEKISAIGYRELTGFSLALKISPRHRVRVYSKTLINELGIETQSVIILTASSPYAPDNDWLLFRKIVAIIPLLENRTETERGTVQCEREDYFRDIERNANADIAFERMWEYLKTVPNFKFLIMQQTINTLKNLNEFHARTAAQMLLECQAQLQSIERDLQQKYAEERQLQYELAGLNDIALAEEDLNLLVSKQIVCAPHIESLTLRYNCVAPCLSYEQNAAKNYYRRHCDDNSAFAKLFKLAFIDEKIIIMFEDNLTINFQSLSLDGQSVSNIHKQSVLRNPHHHYYNCWGNYLPEITRLIKSYSFMQLFLQLKAAVGSLNMTDYTVLGRFRDEINTKFNNERYGSSYPCIVWKDERDISKRHNLTETLEHFKEDL